MKYKIELSYEQLRLLQQSLEKDCRNRVGQLQYGIEEDCLNAIERHSTTPEQDRSSALSLLQRLREICWNQNKNQYYGLRYSEETDTIFDMISVIRNKLFLDDGGEPFSAVIASYPPDQHNEKVPLIKIEKCL